MKSLVALFLISISSVAVAAGDAIPSKMIFNQAFNIILYVGLLIFLLRKPVKNYFVSRKEAFNADVNRAKHLKEEAEKTQKEILAKIEHLEKNAEADIIKAKADAEELKNKIIAEGKAIAANISKEASKTADAEIAKASLELKQELLNSAIELSKENISSKLTADDYKNVNKSFVDQLGAVTQ